ncbi:MAG: hypothetical protein JWL72_1964 [Ilumatobacteraceae bacterium]|nr:hypothetical protein [Ilumatobacteraceae bacterium]MCU1388626.1 hypothetical protein [Ilumatobacteraceae bacterium]
MHRRVATLLAALVLLAVACGAPKSGGFSAIPLGNLPDGLTATTSTTTTTTTTTLPTTTSSTIELIATTTTVEPIPTTTNPTEQVTLYFVADSGTQLVSAPRPVLSPPEVLRVLGELKAGPDPGTGGGLRTAIPSNATLTKSDFRGVLTIDLNPDFFTSMPSPADERLAVAQIVLTLTGMRGISQVRFTMNDEPITVPLGTGEPSTLGQVLVKEDYEALLGNSAPPTTTTTTTIAPPPPTDVSGDPALSTPATG